MKQTAILLLFTLNLHFSVAQTYQSKPWELVGKEITSTEVQDFLKEMGQPSDYQNYKGLITKHPEDKRWADKGINILIDPYREIVIEVTLHSKNDYYSPYPYSLFNELLFEDNAKKILSKIEGFERESSYHDATIRVEKGTYLFIDIDTEKSDLKGGIRNIRHYIDNKKMYADEWEKTGKTYLKTSSDSAWGEMIQATFEDWLFSWDNLEGKIIENKPNTWGIEYNSCPLPNPTDRPSKMKKHYKDPYGEYYDVVIIPIWGQSIPKEEYKDEAQQELIKNINDQVSSVFRKINDYINDNNRFEIVGYWFERKDAKLSDAYLKVRDLKLDNISTIRLYMLNNSNDEAIEILYDMYIYRHENYYDEVLKRN